MTDTTQRHERQSRGAAEIGVTTVANVRAIATLERESRDTRTGIQLLTDRVAAAASSTAFLGFHLVWFTAWIAINTSSTYRFDPFPFNLLTMIVALEAILLTAFVLMSQRHLNLMADRRAHLDLQVNLLAERELTAILQVVCLTAEQAGIDIYSADPNLNELLGRTDVKELAHRVVAEMDGLGSDGATDRNASTEASPPA